MNYVNKTVDKSEPSFPDNSDGKDEFLYGVFNEETESPIWDKYDGWSSTNVFLAILTISLSLNLHRRFESITVIRKVVILQPLQGWNPTSIHYNQK